MRNTALIVGAVLAALVMLAVALPALIDWSRFKAPLIARAESATGRAVTIAGPITLRLLPSPSLSAKDVTIANPPGTTGALATAEHLRLNLALLPLLIGRVEITAIELDTPVLRLTRLADGRPNWQLDNNAEPDSAEATADSAPHRIPKAEPPPPPPSQTDRDVPVEQVIIHHGSVSYGDAGGQNISLEAINAQLSLGGRSGPFLAQGDAQLAGNAVAFDMAVDRIAPGRASPASVTLHVPGDDAKVEFSGLVTRLSGGETLRGRLNASAKDLARTLARLGVTVTLPAGASLSADSDLTVSAEEVSAANLVISLGDTRATGAVTAALKPAPQVDVRLALASLDLDKWRAPVAAAKPSAAAALAPATTPAAPAAKPGGFSLPRAPFISAAVSVEALAWRGQVMRDVTVEAVLDQGEILVSKATALLPGGGGASVDGSLSAENGHPIFDGQARLHADNLRTLLAWAGHDPQSVPPNRLRAFDLSSPIRLAWPELSLSGFRLNLDGAEARGVLNAHLADRLAFGLDATINSLNVDAYGGGAAPMRAAKAAPANTDTPATKPSEAPAPALNALAEFDANVKLSVRHLVVRDTAAEAVTVDALLQGGELTLRQLSIGDILGTQANIQGRVLGLTEGAAKLDKLAFQLTSPQPARLSRSLGRVRSLSASGTVTGDRQALDITALTLSAGPARLTGQGHLDLRGPKPNITADLTGTELVLDALLSERTGMLLPGGPHMPPSTSTPPMATIPAAAMGAGPSPFSTTPLDLSALHSFDARIGLKADVVRAKGWRLDQAIAQISVQNGTAAMDRLTGKLLGGDLVLNAKLSDAPLPTLSGQMSVLGADLGAAHPSAGGLSVTKGRLDGEARFTTSGRSSLDMAARLNGDGKLLVRDGILDGFDLPAVNQKLNNLDNVGSILGVAQAGMSGGQTPFSQLYGSFRAENGIVTSRDLKLDAQGGGATAESVNDLPRWTTSTQIAFHLANAAQTPLGLRLEGPLDNPRKIIDINALQQYLVSRGMGRALKNKDAASLLGGILGKTPPAATDQQQSEQPREKNTGKNILKNLLKGLGGQ